MELYLHSPNTLSLCGPELKEAQRWIYLYLYLHGMDYDAVQMWGLMSECMNVRQPWTLLS